MPQPITPERYEKLFLVAYAGLRPLAFSEVEEEAVRAGRSARLVALTMPRVRKIIREQDQNHPELSILERYSQAMEKISEDGDRFLEGLREWQELLREVRDLLRSEQAEDGPRSEKTRATLSVADAAALPEGIDPCDRTIGE
jgi:hypothetical protein